MSQREKPAPPKDLDVVRVDLPDGELAIFEFSVGAPSQIERLTRAECEVLAALLRGQSNDTIASCPLAVAPLLLSCRCAPSSR